MRPPPRHGGRALAAAVLTLALGAAAADACPQRRTLDPSIPAFAGPADRPASGEAIDAYLEALDAASQRVTSAVAGTSVQGRPIRYAIVSGLTPARLRARLAELRTLRGGRASPVRIARIARRAPAVVWLAGGVHGNEPSGADADLLLLHDLAARTDCAALARLRRVVVVVMPVQNPDGRAAGTRANAAGFDLNRDWFALTQPETLARLTALRRLPPVAFADQHEEGGTSFFFPPNVDPIHHEVPDGALRAIRDTFAPALRGAFARRGLPFTPERTYDLFYMGFADTATATLFGAAGMTFEAGGGAPFARRVREHLTAAQAVVERAAATRERLVGGWARAFVTARAQGARGALEPNAPARPGTPVRPVARTPVYGYALRADRHGADAAALVARLRATGVAVSRLAAATRVAALHPFGARPGAVETQTLPAGTFVVSLAQPAKHWAQALLGDDAFASVPAFYDASAWSNPLLMGLAGGALHAPLAPGTRLAAVGALGPAAPAGDSAGGLGATLRALAAGGALWRSPGDGGVYRTPPTPPPPGAVALRPARVALLADPGASTALPPGTPMPSLSVAWARFVLTRRLGLEVTELAPAALGAGRLAAAEITHLVVPDGTPAGLSAEAAAEVGAFVRAGGTLVGWRSRGVEVARAAGLTTALASRAPSLRAPGAALAVALDPSSPLAWGIGTRVVVVDADDPVLRGGRAVGAYPATRLLVSGSLSGADALAGSPAILDEPAGAGRAILFSFDPVFRASTEGAERLLANALLAPR